MLKKPVVWIAVLVIVVVAAAASPGARTKGYFAFERAWIAHWPFAVGARLPARLERIVRPTTPVWTQVEPGVTMRLDPRDLVSREILRTGAWEAASWDAMRMHLAPGSVFVDVGAHIGYYSLKAARVVGPGGHVIAIEPNPPTVRELEDNVRASGATIVNVQPVACSDAESMLDLFAAPEANTGQTSLSKANASQSGTVAATFHVRARPLDDIVTDAGLTRVDVVKVDVEGAEMLVLKGAVDVLARYHPVVMVELVDQQLRSMGSSDAQVRSFLNAHGYTARGTFEDNVEFAWSGGVSR